jgi:hypothetical protein
MEPKDKQGQKPEIKQTKEQQITPPRVITFFLYSPDNVEGPVGLRTDVEELGGWETTLFIMEKRGSHLWVGTVTLPEGITKKVVYYKYLKLFLPLSFLSPIFLFSIS